jgi:hypothetical protein
VPSVLDAIVGRCLQKKPELRHASMRELESDLRKVQLSPVSEPRPSAPLSSLSLSGSLVGSAPPGAFSAASETLDEAALLSEPPLDEDDVPVEVPKQRPLWLWAVAAGILVMLVLSLSVRSREGQPESPAAESDTGQTPDDTALTQPVPTVDAAQVAVDDLPSGISAPPETPRPKEPAQPEAARPQPVAAPEAARPKAASAPAQPAAARSQPVAAPAQPRNVVTSKPSDRSRTSPKPAAPRGESLLDPWH